MLSFVVPVYNVEQYLEECLNSICRQTYTDIEIICVDDGSIDNSLNILQKYAELDSRIIVLKQCNQGAASARNNGLQVAKGEYVLFVDSDDVVEEDLAEKVFNKALAYDADIVIYNADSFSEKTGKKALLNINFRKYRKFQNECFSAQDIPNEILNLFLVPAWNKLIRKDFLKSNNIEFQNIKRSNDLAFTSKALLKANKILLYDKVFIHYRTGMKNSLQANNTKTPLEFFKALLEVKDYMIQNNIYEEYKYSYLRLFFETVFYTLNSINNECGKIEILEKVKNIDFCFAETNYKLYECFPFTLFMQYMVIKNMDNPSFNILGWMYKVYKLSEYYHATGILNTVKKCVIKVNMKV